MAGKKMKKMARVETVGGAYDSGNERHKLEIWIMFLLGLIGFLSALGFLNFGVYFQYIWSVLILAMAMTKLVSVKL